MSSWILVGFVTTELQWELPTSLFLWLIFFPTTVITVDCIASLMMLKILHLLSEKNILQ